VVVKFIFILPVNSRAFLVVQVKGLELAIVLWVAESEPVNKDVHHNSKQRTEEEHAGSHE
jgi:hypothetical protein